MIYNLCTTCNLCDECAEKISSLISSGKCKICKPLHCNQPLLWFVFMVAVKIQISKITFQLDNKYTSNWIMLLQIIFFCVFTVSIFSSTGDLKDKLQQLLEWFRWLHCTGLHLLHFPVRTKSFLHIYQITCRAQVVN